MSEYLERTDANKPTFGDYVTLEMKCYGVPNEHFIHEVLSSPFTSNSWREVPIKAGDFEEQLHDTRETVIAVRTQGLNSRDGHIFAVRLADVLPMKGADWSWRESPLRSRIAELEAEVTKCHELQDAYCDRIAELEAAQKWHVVADGDLPIFGKSVMFYDPHSREIYRGVYTASLHWQANNFSDKGKTVTHWMPLPKFPEVQ